MNGVAFSPDGQRIATASSDHTAKLRDAASGQELLTLRGHSGWVNAVAFSPDSNRLATAGEDHMVQVYAIDIHLLLDLAQHQVLLLRK